MKSKGTISQDTAGNGRFRRMLLAWFDRHQRDLPWRADRDPYRVWLSEVMLQQTRVAAVVQHYKLFLRRFPSIEKLARARESSVLAAWSGLGYYRRARMLHAAAKRIMKERAGVFPTTAEDLRTLPGIGRYTAAAIASIAFGEPAAVVDGNVERVLRRMAGKNLSDKSLWLLAGQLLDPKRPGDFNQALMELGATVCLPRQPRCELCPVNVLCATRGEHPSSKQTNRQRKREIQYALSIRGRLVLLVQRPSHASLMPGMWELPEVPAQNGSEPWLTLRHSITVTDYLVRVIQDPRPNHADGLWIPRSRLAALPLTGLARKILRAGQLI
jgi:A/G-specific adenine glycosylase